MYICAMGYSCGYLREGFDPNFKFTEEFMQDKLSGFFARNSVKYDLDGLYVFDWESDKLLETKSGYIYEFEVKVSKTDFKNDFKHKKDKHIILEGGGNYTDKYIPKYYENLEQSKKYGKWAEQSFHKYSDDNPRYLVEGHQRPNYFYYAVPVDLINVEDVPSYAGLVYINQYGNISIIKKAPCLHKEKYNDNDLNLGEKFYYNMVKWRDKTKAEIARKEIWKRKFNDEIISKGQSVAYKELEEKCKSLEQTNKELTENMQKSEQALNRELYNVNRINRNLIHEVQKYNPEFNYWEFEKEIL